MSDNKNTGDDAFKRFLEAVTGTGKALSALEQGVTDTSIDNAMGTTSDISEDLKMLADAAQSCDKLQFGAMAGVIDTFNKTIDMLDGVVVISDPDRVERGTVKPGVATRKTMAIVDPSAALTDSGMVEYLDLCLLAAMAAMKSYVFNRIRKVNSACRICQKMLDAGGVDALPRSVDLMTTHNATAQMFNLLQEMGITLTSDAARKLQLHGSLKRLGEFIGMARGAEEAYEDRKRKDDEKGEEK